MKLTIELTADNTSDLYPNSLSILDGDVLIATFGIKENTTDILSVVLKDPGLWASFISSLLESFKTASEGATVN